jgi:hypothetical protein
MQKSPEPSGAEYKHMLMKYFPSKSEASVRNIHVYRGQQSVGFYCLTQCVFCVAVKYGDDSTSVEASKIVTVH